MNQIISNLQKEQNLLQQRLAEIENLKQQELQREQLERSREMNQKAIAQQQSQFEEMVLVAEKVNSLIEELRAELSKLKKFPSLGSGHYPDGSYKQARLSFSNNLFELPVVKKDGDRYVLTSESFRV